jgi:serine/threonine-protein kinase
MISTFQTRYAEGSFGLTGAVLLLAVFVFLQVVARDFSLTLETEYLDLFNKARNTRPDERILLIDAGTDAITEQDTQSLKLVIDKLAQLGTESIVLTMMPRPEVNARNVAQLQTLVQLQERARESGVEVGAVTHNSLRAELDDLRSESERQAALTDSVRRAGNVYLAIDVAGGAVASQSPCPAQVVAISEGLRPMVTGMLRHVGGGGLAGVLCDAAAGVGHVGYWPDTDGIFRRTEWLVGVSNTVLPSLALTAASGLTKSENAGLMIDTTGTLSVEGNRFSAPTRFVSFNHYYARPQNRNMFPVVKAGALLDNAVDDAQFHNRIAIVGPLDSPNSELFRLPDNSLVTRSMLLATSLSNLLGHDFATRPGFLRGWEALLMLLAGLLLLLTSTFRTPGTRLACAVLLTLSIIAIEVFLLLAHGIWMQLMTASFFVLIGTGCLEILRSFYPSRGITLSPNARNAEMLIGHDAMDMEFAMLRNSAPTDEAKAQLSDLANRYENAGHRTKAERVLQHLVSIDAENDRAREKLLELSDGQEDGPTSDRAANVTTISPDAQDSPVKPVGDRRKADRRADDRRGGGRRALDAVPPDDLPTLQTLGRYQLIRELGHGAMAHVYLAEDPEIRRQVAIKTLALADEFEHKELEKAQHQFTREAQSAGRLNHPNIISIYDFGVEQGLSYLAMEYFNGKPVSDWATPKNFLPVTWVLELAAQTADALHYAHNQGVIHRDIKPANLLYDPARDIIKITDFGIARLTDHNRTQSGIILGTPYYMSPEQLRGEAVTGQSDLYSLGICLYQLLTGSVPFRSLGLPALLEQICQQDHEPASVLREDLPPEIDGILNRALAKDANDRYINGRAMAVAMRDVVRASAA